MNDVTASLDNEDTPPFDRRVLTAVRHLTESSGAGTSPQSAIQVLGKEQQTSAVDLDADFVLAVARLRQGGLLMSNPTGDLRLTSAGQHQLSRIDALESEDNRDAPDLNSGSTSRDSN